MKFFVLLLTLFLAIPFSVNAAETDNTEVDYRAFCNEQAELAGIVDSDEKKQYVDTCLINYGISPAE